MRKSKEPNGNGEYLYKADDGNIIAHRIEDGSVPLAIKMLGLIKTKDVDA